MADETTSGAAAQPAPAAPLSTEATLVQPPPYEAQTAAPGSAPEPPAYPVAFDTEPPKPSNFLVGLAAGVGLGLLAAIAYAVFTVVTEFEIGWLAILIGAAVAFGFTRFGHTKGIAAGLVAALVAFGSFFVAIFVAMAGLNTKEFGDPFITSLSLAIQNAGALVELYFQDPKSYLFVALPVIIAFAYASGLRDKKIGKQA